MALDTNWANRLIADIMQDFNVTREVAQGITGALAMESKGFTDWQEDKPMVPGSRGGGGMAQWTGVRRTAYEDYVKKTGQTLDSYEAQYGYLREELMGVGGHDKRVMRKLADVGDARTAAKVFTDVFLRPDKAHAGMTHRYNWTDQVVGGYVKLPPSEIPRVATQIDVVDLSRLVPTPEPRSKGTVARINDALQLKVPRPDSPANRDLARQKSGLQGPQPRPDRTVNTKPIESVSNPMQVRLPDISTSTLPKTYAGQERATVMPAIKATDLTRVSEILPGGSKERMTPGQSGFAGQERSTSTGKKTPGQSQIERSPKAGLTPIGSRVNAMLDSLVPVLEAPVAAAAVAAPTPTLTAPASPSAPKGSVASSTTPASRAAPASRNKPDDIVYTSYGVPMRRDAFEATAKSREHAKPAGGTITTDAELFGNGGRGLMNLLSGREINDKAASGKGGTKKGGKSESNPIGDLLGGIVKGLTGVDVNALYSGGGVDTSGSKNSMTSSTRSAKSAAKSGGGSSSSGSSSGGGSSGLRPGDRAFNSDSMSWETKESKR